MQEILIFIALTAVIAGAIAVLVQRAAAARAAALRETAARLGWRFHEEVLFTMIPDLERFELFRPGRKKKLRNLLTSPAGEPRAVLFEYSYTMSSGRSQQTHRQTVLYATSADGFELARRFIGPRAVEERTSS